MLGWGRQFAVLCCRPNPNFQHKKFKKKIKLSCDKVKSVEVARRMFAKRFPDADLKSKTLQEMMGMEGNRVRDLYEQKAKEYQVGWKGRKYTPGKFKMGDITNQILISSNAALYCIISSVVHSLGFSPYIEFIHSGSPLPFVYDLADLYKEYLCIDLAFSLTLEMAGQYNKYLLSNHFRQRVIEIALLTIIGGDISALFERL